jgi:hypothetical protein
MLQEAAAGGHFNIVKMLLTEYGHEIDINKPSRLGRMTALHLAVEQSHRAVCSLLLTHGADLNAKDDLGNTPLHLVSDFSVVKLLFKFEVDPVIRNLAKRTALENYQYRIPLEEQSRDILDFMKLKEEHRFVELAKRKNRTEEKQLEAKLAKNALILSSTKSINTSSKVSLSLFGQNKRIANTPKNGNVSGANSASNSVAGTPMARIKNGTVTTAIRPELMMNSSLLALPPPPGTIHEEYKKDQLEMENNRLLMAKSTIVNDFNKSKQFVFPRKIASAGTVTTSLMMKAMPPPPTGKPGPRVPSNLVSLMHSKPPTFSGKLI